MSKKAPIIAIVGRTNVGKSSLFNVFVGHREAVVADEPGTTRDSIFARVQIEDSDFWLVDTAGLKDAEDEFEFTIQEQITQAADSADMIWVVIEANAQIGDEDRRLAKLALKTQKPVVLVVNKADTSKQATAKDFQKLGIKTIILTSATQRRGVDELADATYQALPHVADTPDESRVKLALIGRPNVGKSALFNTLAKKQQAIVADRAGTTRDVNRTEIRFHNTTIELLDTAGIRRSGKIDRGVERFSVVRSLAAIEEADVCLLLIDVNELSVKLDQKLAGMIKEAGKGLVIVVSKWDSSDKDAYTRDALAPQIQADFDFVPWAPLIFTSSVTGQNVAKILEIVSEIMERRRQSFTTRELNRWLQKAINQHPPAGLKNRHPRLRYMVHEEGNPVPSFKIYGSQIKFLHWSYKRYLERNLREAWDFSGTPVKLWSIENHGTASKKDHPEH